MKKTDPFSKENYNPTIPEGILEKLKKLNLLPQCERDLELRFDKYVTKNELSDTNAQIAREIVRRKKDIRFGDLLTEEHKKAISETNIELRKKEGKKPEDIINFNEIRENLYKRGIPIWSFRFPDDPERDKVSIYGWVAETYHYAVQWGHIDNKGKITISEDDEEWDSADHLKTLLKPLKEFSHLVPQNQHDELQWELIDRYYTTIFPTTRTFLETKLLEKLGLYPYAPLWAMIVSAGQLSGGEQIEKYFEMGKQIAESTGVPLRIFKVVERYYHQEAFREFEPKRERLMQPFFFIAYVLKEKYPQIFRYYKMRVEGFMFKDLNGLREKKQIDILQKQKEKLKDEEEIMPDFTIKDIGIEGDDKVTAVGKEGKPVWQSSERIRQKEMELDEKLYQLDMKNEIRVRDFITLLNFDFLLGCVFYTYVLNGFEKLKLKKEPHRPGDRTIGKTIVYLCDKLNPYKDRLPIIIEKRSVHKRREDFERANLYYWVSQLLNKLTGDKTKKTYIKKYYSRYKKKKF